DQMQLVRPNVFGAELLRRLTKVPREPRHVIDVRHLRLTREVPNPHVLKHPLSKRCHGPLLPRTAWHKPGARQGAYARITVRCSNRRTGADRGEMLRTTYSREAG